MPHLTQSPALGGERRAADERPHPQGPPHLFEFKELGKLKAITHQLRYLRRGVGKGSWDAGTVEPTSPEMQEGRDTTGLLLNSSFQAAHCLIHLHL